MDFIVNVLGMTTTIQIAKSGRNFQFVGRNCSQRLAFPLAFPDIVTEIQKQFLYQEKVRNRRAAALRLYPMLGG
jgi:hypothetical protein